MSNNLGFSSDDMMQLARSVSDNKIAASLTALTTAAAVGTAAYLAFRNTPFEGDVDLDDQSIVIDEKEGIRSSKFAKDGKLINSLTEDLKTLHEVFLRGCQISGNGQCLGWRPDRDADYQWITYGEVLDRARSFGSSLITTLNQPAKNDTMVGIYATNCPEWVIVEQACNMFSMVVVPLYDTLGTEACTYIINQTEMEIVVCDTDEKAQQLLRNCDSTPHFRYLVVVKDISKETQKLAKDKLKLYSYSDLLESGRKNWQELNPPKATDLSTICYTSGTTGDPKGVVLTHRNITATCGGFYQHMVEDGKISFTPDDIHISYLPLAHMFERASQVYVFVHGARVGFFRGDVRELASDMAALRPTMLCTVPRVLNRVYDKVISAVAGSPIKAKLLKWAIQSKMEERRRGIIRRNSVWDYLVFRKVQNTMGGRIRMVMVGSAPLSVNVLDFCRAALGCHFYEGYGQTECAAATTCTVAGEWTAGHVGPPLSCNYIKLVDVVDLDIQVKRDGRGEVCIKGANCTSGYYKEPEKTKELIDEDGWLHTGDIGLWLPNGALKIVDRCKHIFKLAQGEYVAPEKLEQVYSQCRHVGQIFVSGNSLRSCTVAIVVPDFDVLARTLNEGSGGRSMAELCADPAVRKMILEEMTAAGKQNAFKGFEHVKAIHLTPDAFTIENGLLTPTMKSKRPSLHKLYADVVNQLYKELGEN